MECRILGELRIQARMEALAEAGRQYKDAVIRHQDNHIPRGVKNQGANFAGFQMLVDIGAQGRVHVPVDVGGDLLPDVFAVDPHARPPNQPLRLGANPFNCGVSSRCSKARARCSRTLTAPSLMPRALAVSRISISSMFRKITMSRD